MKSTKEYIELLRQFMQQKGAKYGISRMGIFGSVARGEQNENSDVDILFEGKANLLLHVRIKNELEELLGSPVDLVRMRNQLNGTSLKQSILNDVIFV
ncbi:nucleotidyltransferase family protein [Parabacteroides gordonii]|uniref:Polymerase nucleotidyl transferase domain-containing protein n=1 Tax=Parabacteroides gordonii MS-1 = DSM 23371 TaxID=1203610 RepID=A0A0F5IXI8_9BACT|nr:nucleotidyltransferase family protein [Parabacteroides gordonii]KKB50223.1 hypothetical protein HMPREF1536_04202 [Parabacteroides gordonii MS-1 = DSM 23371]MCA5585417.1 nucleotidyltransferase family protein [Parabacteroides gordonii]RGP08284.1 DNA polymerase subunit beta [Parabacteroides gordonii]